VIFANENEKENFQKWKNDSFVDNNEKIMKTKTKLK